MNTELKQQYLARMAASGVSEAEAQTLWACLAKEIGYGNDYSTEISLVDKIAELELAMLDKVDGDHTHTTGDISGLAVVATTGSYSSLSGTPNLAPVATSGNYSDLTGAPAAYSHPATHPASMISGLSDVATSGSYNDLTDKPTIPTIPASLPANGGNADTVDGMHASEFAVANHTHTQYANATHGHAVSEITGLTGELDGKADVGHTHNYAASTHAHTLADVTETSEKKVFTADERTKLEGIAANANNYTHPATHAASMITGLSDVATSGSYDDLTDKPTTMTPAAHTHAQGDVTGLATALAGKAATEHTHNQSDVSGLSDALAGKANATHTHNYASTTHAHEQSDITGLATALSGKANASHTHNYAASTHAHAQSEITGLGTALSGKANTSHTHEQSAITGLSDALSGKANASHTHTASDVGAAAENHNHDSAYMSKDLQFTNASGGVEFSYGADSDANVLTEISGMSQGFHTIYAISGTDGNPESTDSYRFLVHKTATNIGWILAFGAQGSVYENYQSAAGTFKGWRTIFSTTYAPLWTGSWYVNGTQTVTPSKKLSECEHGWILLWSDFDVDNNKAVDSDYCTTMIPKKCGSANWSGQSHIALVSTNMTNTDDGFTCKRLYVHDDKITGHNANSAAPRNDVVLRAVYEF